MCRYVDQQQNRVLSPVSGDVVKALLVGRCRNYVLTCMYCYDIICNGVFLYLRGTKGLACILNANDFFTYFLSSNFNVKLLIPKWYKTLNLANWKYKKPWFHTGKSLSEALLFAEHGENMLCTKIVLNVRNTFCTQNVLARFKLGIFMYWTCNSMNNLS